MTLQQVALVIETADRIQPVAAEADRLFAGRLATLDPSLRPMLDGTIGGVLGRAVQALQIAEGSAPGMEAISRCLEIRSLRHEQYSTIGATLLWTLDQVLGAGFTNRVRDAWQANAETELWFLLGVLSVSGVRT